MTNVGTWSASCAGTRSASSAPGALLAKRSRTAMRDRSARLLAVPLLGVFLLWLVAACGHGGRPPIERLASSEAAIRTAKDLDVHGDERSALLVQLAEEEVAIAKNRMREGEDRRADLALQRAESDAALATMLIRERMAKAAARKARERLEQKTAGAD